MDLFEKRRKAFTFIELIVVIAIIIILAGIGIPFTSNVIAERSLYNAATQVQQDILLIQNLAITHSSDNAARFRIRFYPTQNRYVIEASEDANLVTGKGKLIKRQFTSTIGFPLFFGKNVPDSVVFGVKSCPPSSYLDVSFNNSGVPHTGGGHINLINKSGSKQIKVIVSLIGRVRIEWVKK
ncbi:MAG: prepilin-type N-terminal cleavage/methylation domain-containing protein [Bacteroidia bacterium]|nr:prepilin-type N-terminal cleavage/methylation domain-containing protein [Bacteroidia bacterium]